MLRNKLRGISQMSNVAGVADPGFHLSETVNHSTAPGSPSPATAKPKQASSKVTQIDLNVFGAVHQVFHVFLAETVFFPFDEFIDHTGKFGGL